MNVRLVTCLFAATLSGVVAAAFVVASGAGVLAALLAYSGLSSVALFGLAVATMPRDGAPARSPLVRVHGSAA